MCMEESRVVRNATGYIITSAAEASVTKQGVRDRWVAYSIGAFRQSNCMP